MAPRCTQLHRGASPNLLTDLTESLSPMYVSFRTILDAIGFVHLSPLSRSALLKAAWRDEEGLLHFVQVVPPTEQRGCDLCDKAGTYSVGPVAYCAQDIRRQVEAAPEEWVTPVIAES